MAELWEANLKNANFYKTNFQKSSVFSPNYNRFGKYLEIKLKKHDDRIDSGFKSLAQNQELLERYRNIDLWHRVKYYLWLISLDCGRLPIWIVWLATLFLLNFVAF